MQGSIRRLGTVFIVLAVVLVITLSFLQVFGQDDLVGNPANTRRLIEEYGIARGRIVTADGLVVAESVPAEGPFEYRRSYAAGSLLSHVVGYDSPQFGRTGLEEYYNQYLLGRRPARGWALEMTSDLEKGNDITLTIDSELQAVAAEALGPNKGAVIAMDPKTGAVLAMYSWPTFDPNALVSQGLDAEGNLAADAIMRAYAQDPASPLLNRASMGLFTPGSSFKVFTAAAGVDSGIPVSTEYDCPPEYFVGGSSVVNYAGSPNGVMDMDYALTFSVNTYFAQLALAMGAPTLVSYAERFGMNGAPPLDYPAVSPAFIPQPGEMDEVELAWTGAGQGRLLMTPLQLCLAGCAIANGGEIMLPHLMKDVRLGDDILERFDADEWRSPISAETASQVLEMMVHVVEDGTGAGAAVPGVTVAGKTGTAEVAGRQPHAWFIGIAPAENPTLVVAVVVENAGAGGDVAAPIAGEVIGAALE
ncbi:MAG: penicillin-binding transpeptidase domain-containing protein [Actinomycetota bacterium]